MSVIFQRREVLDRILLIQFQFETHNVKGNRNDFTCCSLDKYLSLDVWSQIYTKLEAPFERYKNNVNHHPKSETIQLRRAQLDLRVSWPKCETYHTDVIDHMVKDMDKEKENGCDVCPYVMLINVSMVSVLDKYKKLHSNTKKTDTTTAKSDKRSSDDSNETRQSASSSTNDTEEYVPAARTNVSSGLKYTPSTLVGSTSTEQLTSDEYTPTKRETIEDEHGSVSYTPTKIVQSDKTSFRGTAEQKHKAATDLNRKNCTEKKKRLEPRYSTDLFDSDSNNEDVKQPNTRSKYDGLVIPSTPLDSPNEPHKTATDLNRNDCTEKKKRFGRHNSAYLFGDDLNSEAVSQSSIRSKYDRQVKQSTSLDLPNKSHKTETDLNRNDCTEKKKRLAVQNSGELFGDDPNSKVVNQSGVRSKYDRLVKQPTSLDSPKPHKTQTNLSSWVTTERGKKTHISKVHGGGSDENSKKRKIDAISPIELSTPKPPNKVDDELEKMRKLRQEMDELYEDVTVDRMIDLKKESIDKILNSFSRFEEVLLAKFNEHRNTPDRSIDPLLSECDYLMILDCLVTSDQQQAMYKKLRSEFCKSDPKDAITSNHENLLWKITMPEWALRIAMRRFNLDRNQAIDQLNKQNQVEINHLSGLDLDF